MKTGILFDLDGTLWDSSESVVRSWNEIIEKQPDTKGPGTIDDMKRLMGRTMKEIADDFFGYLEPKRRYELLSECMLHENEYIREHGGILMDGLIDVLTELKKSCSLYIVSNCQEGYVPAFLYYHGLASFFDSYEEYGRTGRPKSDNIRLVVERESLDRAVYVGDTKGDLDSAGKAGVPFIHAAYGFGSVPFGTPSIASIRELPSFLSRFFAD